MIWLAEKHAGGLSSGFCEKIGLKKVKLMVGVEVKTTQGSLQEALRMVGTSELLWLPCLRSQI